MTLKTIKMKLLLIILFCQIANVVLPQHINYAEDYTIVKTKRIKTATIKSYKGNDTLNAITETKIYYDSLTGKPTKMVAFNPSLPLKNTFDFTFYNCPEGLMLKRYRLIAQRGTKVDTTFEKISSNWSHGGNEDSCSNNRYDFYRYEADHATPAERVFNRLGSSVSYYPNGLRKAYVFTEKPVDGNAEGKVNSRLRFEYEFYRE